MKQSKIGIMLKLKELRRRLKLTQEALAHKLGVSFTSVNRWENGQIQPSPLAKSKIEELFELSIKMTPSKCETNHEDKK